MPDDLDFTTTQDEAQQPDQPIKEAAQDAPKALYIETPAHPMTTEETLEALKQMPAEEFQAHIDSLRATMDNSLKTTQESIKKAIETVTEFSFSSLLSSSMDSMDSLLSSLKQFAIQPSTITESVSASLQKLAESLQELQAEALKQDRETIREYLDSEEYKKLTPYFKGVKKKLEAVYNDPDNEETSYWAIFIRNVEDVFALDKEIKRYIRTEHQGRKLTLDEFVSVDDEDSKSIFELLEDQKQNLPDDTDPTTDEADKRETVQISSRQKTLNFPLDKVNSVIWNLFASDTGKTLPISAEGRKKKPIDILYSIDFDNLGPNLQISVKLDPYDYLVYMAISSLYSSGYQIVTLGQIYYTMGYDGFPGSSDINKINASISKMNAAHITVDNTQEANAYKGYPRFLYDASLLPMERISICANGKNVDSAIRLFREPPMQTFAQQRKQITTIDRKVLQTPLNKTNENILIEIYLITRISHLKKGNSPAKILYDTLFTHANISNPTQRMRAKEKIAKILDHYISCNFISGYSADKDGVTIKIQKGLPQKK